MAELAQEAVGPGVGGVTARVQEGRPTDLRLEAELAQ